MLMQPGAFLSRILLTEDQSRLRAAGALGITPNVSFF